LPVLRLQRPVDSCESMKDAPTLEDVLAARETIGGRLHRTPVFTSATLSELTGARVYLKAELLQRTGSFKPRGVLNSLASLSPEERRSGVIGISAGNHAQAVAFGATGEGLDALLVMWQGASEQKIAATRAYGASVDLTAAGPAEAFERLEELLATSGRTLIHPFDSAPTIAGQGTVGLEIAEDVPDVDVVVVPVGGGGLIAGIATAMSGLRPSTRVIGVEPELSTALHSALAAGDRVEVVPRSIADGLNAPHAGRLALATCQRLEIDVVLVSEDEIRAGFRFLYERAKLACEPAGAAGVAALLAGKVALEPGETAAVVVSGGNVAARTASDILGSSEA
jgi:threo-3-hydroxy-L-aspartate ammonia-lyase